MKQIPLTQGFSTMIDDEDYNIVQEHKWCVEPNKRTKYAVTSNPSGWKKAHIRMHRLLLTVPKGMEVDHINGNGLDNRRCNLRLCTHQQNTRNVRNVRTNKSSMFKGVCWNKESKNWMAYIMCGGKQKTIGRFQDETTAAEAYNIKAKELFGEFANPNF